MPLSNRKVALVTGGNKGIGLEIVRGLCRQFDGDVILAARNVDLGEKAVAKLKEDGLQPKLLQLDITDQSTIDGAKRYLEETYGGLDVLVNNAGIALEGPQPPPLAEHAELCARTNFTGTLDVCKTLFPLLRDHARVVNVASIRAQWETLKCSAELREKFYSDDLTISQVVDLMDDFVQCSKEGKNAERGWSLDSYSMSKLGVLLMTFVQQREFNKDQTKDIVVNTCCPGYTATDMTEYKGFRTPEKGADVSIYLALLPPEVQSPRGEYVSDRKVGNWKSPEPLVLEK